MRALAILRSARSAMLVALPALSLALLSPAAHAEETTRSAPRSVVIIVDGCRIRGHAPPFRTFDIPPVVPRLPLSELKKPLVERIAAAVEKDPF